MRAASSAPLRAPSIATAATGVPGGICSEAIAASMPPSAPEAIGTAITGRSVCAALTPARCAAIPANAMIARKPAASAPRAQAAASSGVRCAESTRISLGISSSASASSQSSTRSRSLGLPAISRTRGPVLLTALLRTGADVWLAAARRLAVRDEAVRRIVRRDAALDAVPGDHADVEAAHASRELRRDLVLVVEHHQVPAAAEHLLHLSAHRDQIVLRHPRSF